MLIKQNHLLVREVTVVSKLLEKILVRSVRSEIKIFCCLFSLGKVGTKRCLEGSCALGRLQSGWVRLPGEGHLCPLLRQRLVARRVLVPAVVV